MRDNVEIVPNLTHVVSQDQKLYFYYEVYDPGQTRRRARKSERASRSIAAR